MGIDSSKLVSKRDVVGSGGVGRWFSSGVVVGGCVCTVYALLLMKYVTSHGSPGGGAVKGRGMAVSDLTPGPFVQRVCATSPSTRI